MADYKELLRRAVEALPENNGAARRAVYEKARAALVGQLRAISPPLAARDITTHRLQLEDCIRQVEQEASEAVIAGLGQEPAAPPAPPPVFETPKPLAARPKAVEPKSQPPQGSIEDIITASEKDTRGSRHAEPRAPESRGRPPKSQPVLVAKNAPRPEPVAPRREPEPLPEPEPEEIRPAPRQNNRPVPSIVARAEAAKGRAAPATAFGVPEKPYDTSNTRRGPSIEPRRDSRSNAVAARQIAPLAFEDFEDEMPAMSTVREVEVENQAPDPQRAIDRAIATLDREARGDEPGGRSADVEMDDDDGYDEPAEPPVKKKSFMDGMLSEGVSRDDEPAFKPARDPRKAKPAKEFAQARRSNSSREQGFPRAREERGGMGAVGIFLIVFVVLLAGVGGAGFWAWQEGYINLDAMFGKGQVATAQAVATNTAKPATASGPGNTDTPVAGNGPSTELKAEERLSSTPVAVADTATIDATAPLALQSPNTEAKTEDRLDTQPSAEAGTPETAVAAIDPASVAGSQSLLLEASDNGTTGAVPFSGTVDWSKGTDETGQPTLIGKASIPARNLSVDVLIRKNSDPSLPASHLMEINFSVSNTFIGGSIAGLPGVLLKNEELVQGAPLVGASARVVGNSFLFALSAAPEDSTANVNLLTSRKWMDLALIYATGKRAIITLEKDDKAQKLFTDVFASWSKTASN